MRNKAWDAADNYTLNPMAQGGGLCRTLGFPSSGHAHNTKQESSRSNFIGSGIRWLANTPGVNEV